MMNGNFGIFGAISSLAIIESIIRMFFYIAVICVSFKGIQALNVYINRNSR